MEFIPYPKNAHVETQPWKKATHDFHTQTNRLVMEVLRNGQSHTCKWVADAWGLKFGMNATNI